MNDEKKEHFKNFLKGFAALEQQMEPFKEQRKDLRKSFKDNGWLTTQEMQMAVKALRLYEKEADFDLMTVLEDIVEETFGPK
jgi:hypothetical protein